MANVYLIHSIRIANIRTIINYNTNFETFFFFFFFFFFWYKTK
jgi:hypothetical protein